MNKKCKRCYSELEPNNDSKLCNFCLNRAHLTDEEFDQELGDAIGFDINDFGCK
jgi:hypothetical protein